MHSPLNVCFSRWWLWQQHGWNPTGAVRSRQSAEVVCNSGATDDAWLRHLPEGRLHQRVPYVSMINILQQNQTSWSFCTIWVFVGSPWRPLDTFFKLQGSRLVRSSHRVKLQLSFPVWSGKGAKFNRKSSHLACRITKWIPNSSQIWVQILKQILWISFNPFGLLGLVA